MPITQDLSTEHHSWHIPGSGIDFTLIGGLQVLRGHDAVQPAPPRVRSAIRTVPAERLVRIDVRSSVGDILIRKRPDGRCARPMQVRHAENGWCVAIDDPSLGRPRKFEGFSDGAFGPSLTWRVLDAWGIHRCPRCGAPGHSVVYGLPAGPAGPGVILGGCVRVAFEGQIGCSRCPARWDSSSAVRDAAARYGPRR